MLRTGILNPALLALLARVRHTNTVVIADRGFPFWPLIETIDLSLVDDVPTVSQVLAAIRQHYIIGHVFIADEFRLNNNASVQVDFFRGLENTSLQSEPHEMLKRRVPGAIGLIRTGDTRPYSNLVIESGVQ